MLPRDGRGERTTGTFVAVVAACGNPTCVPLCFSKDKPPAGQPATSGTEGAGLIAELEIRLGSCLAASAAASAAVM